MEESPIRLVERLSELQQIIKEKPPDYSCPFILSTIHASKGLEYDTVYLLDVIDGILPDQVLQNPRTASKEELESYEEERRLFYVGITRAKNQLNVFTMKPQSSDFCDELFGRKVLKKPMEIPKKAAVVNQLKIKREQPKTISDTAYQAFLEQLGVGMVAVKAVKMAVRALKRQNTPKIDGWYVGIIHPDIAYDLMEDPEWKEWHKYTNPDNAYQNEIGEIGGVRFVESTEAKIFAKTGSAGTGSTKIDVYSTLILGANAYGVTEITGGGLETIVKQLGSGGTADPLNQRATAGWKATKTAERLVEQYVVRVETGCTFSEGKEN